VSCSRILSGRAQLKDYEAGMDLKLAPDKESSFKIFQSRILTEYEKIRHEYGLVEIDATHNIGDQQQLVRKLVDQALVDYRPDETVPFHPSHLGPDMVADEDDEMAEVDEQEAGREFPLITPDSQEETL
jgi:hypothetical protein